MNLSLTRILFLFAGFIAFIRDYFFVSDILYELILSILFIEAIASNLIDVIILRANNFLKNENVYYSKNFGLKIIIILFFILCSVLTFLYFIFYILKFNFIFFLLCTVLPFNAVYRYLYTYFNINKSLYVYQILEVYKHSLNLIAFYYAEPLLIVFNYISIALFAFYYWNNTSQNVPKDLFGLNSVIKSLKEDKLYLLNSFVLLLPPILDKFIYIDGISSLEYLLITKYIFFQLTFLNTGYILPKQIEYKENNKYFDSKAWVKESNYFLLILIIFQYLFFFYFVRALPVAKILHFNQSIILAGLSQSIAVVLVVLIHRELISRNMSKEAAKIILIMTVINLLISLLINYIGPSITMLLQSCILVVATYLMRNIIINKNINKKIP